MAIEEFGCNFVSCGKAQTCERFLNKHNRKNKFKKPPYNKYDDTIACYFYKKANKQIGNDDEH